jgi:hypothetical protein
VGDRSSFFLSFSFAEQKMNKYESGMRMKWQKLLHFFISDGASTGQQSLTSQWSESAEMIPGKSS